MRLRVIDRTRRDPRKDTARDNYRGPPAAPAVMVSRTLTAGDRAITRKNKYPDGARDRQRIHPAHPSTHR